MNEKNGDTKLMISMSDVSGVSGRCVGFVYDGNAFFQHKTAGVMGVTGVMCMFRKTPRTGKYAQS
jgi:hypothetical protein